MKTRANKRRTTSRPIGISFTLTPQWPLCRRAALFSIALLAMSGGLYAAGGGQAARAVGQAHARKRMPQPTDPHIVPPTPLNARLWKAIEQGDLNTVRALIAQGASADARIVTLYQGKKLINPLANVAAQCVQHSANDRKRFLPVFQWLIAHVSNIESTDDYGYTLLMQAVLIDDLASVKLLVRRGAKINVFPKYPSGNALFFAIKNTEKTGKDPSPVTLFLLEHGANTNVQDEDKDTPLILAAKMGKIETVKALLAHGANPSLLNDREDTALRMAVAMRRTNVVQFLADVTPLDIFEAAEFGKVKRVRALLDAGRNVNSQNENGMTLLLFAIQSGNAQVVQLLLNRGAKIGPAGADGFSPLLCAAACGNTAIAALLLDRGADVNVVFHTPADPARESSPLLSLLMNIGRDFLDFTRFIAKPAFSTPLTVAADAADADMIDLLIRRGADVKQNDQGIAALEQAVLAMGQRLRASSGNPAALKADALIANQLRAVERLLAAGVDARADHSRALYLAALDGQPKLVSLLLQKGADVNGRGPAAAFADTENEPTVLMGAIQAWDERRAAKQKPGIPSPHDSDVEKARANSELRKAEASARGTVELLLAKGADANAANSKGITPLMQCQFFNFAEAALLLLDKGANVDAADKRGRTLLMESVTQNKTAFVELLLAHKADVNKRDNRGATALMLAIAPEFNNDILRQRPGEDPLALLRDQLPDEDRQPDMVRLLLEHGADVNLAADDGTTALQLAQKNKFKRVIALLTKAGAK